MSKKIVVEIPQEVAQMFCALAENEKLATPATRDFLEQVRPQLEGALERSVIEWHRPEFDEKDWVFNTPDEGEEVLVRLKSGDYLIDEVCGDDVGDAYAIWLDRTQDWHDVDAWAHLPKEK